MTLVRIRNNSQSLITLPAVGNVSETVKGPQDAIRLPPGSTTEVEGDRLKLYESPAFLSRFDEGKHGEQPDLEILPRSAPLRSSSDLLKSYEEVNAGKPVAPPEVKVTGTVPRTQEPGSNTLPVKPIGTALDVVG